MRDFTVFGETPGGIAKIIAGSHSTVHAVRRAADSADEMSVKRIRLRFTSDAGCSGAWHGLLEHVPGGTRIAVVERATFPSRLGRIVARLMFDPTEVAAAYLAALNARVEGVGGEETDRLQPISVSLSTHATLQSPHLGCV